MATSISNYNTNTRTLNFLTEQSSESNNSLCKRPYTDADGSMIRSNFYHLHKHNIKPLTDKVREQRLNRKADNQEVISYLKKIQMFDVKFPKDVGSRDILYQLHTSTQIPLAERRSMLRDIYHDKVFQHPFIYNENRILLSRGPCKFPTVKFMPRTFPDPPGSGNYVYRPKAKDGKVKLPVELHKLLEHAVHWGAFNAQKHADSNRNRKLADRISKKFANGFGQAALPWGPHNHAGDLMQRMAKSLNIGNIQETSDTDSAFKVWSLIQSHLWSGHRCLISQYRRNFSRGFGKGLQGRKRVNNKDINDNNNNHNNNNSNNNNNDNNNNNNNNIKLKRKFPVDKTKRKVIEE